LTDVSHFVRDFEKTYGLSPARYRAVHVADEVNRPCLGATPRTAKMARLRPLTRSSSLAHGPEPNS
jgi:AraC-like DNA-binding protein